jgi:peptidoglycan/xylan/chitin deacetylase (PgdA/CDA1 family)
MKQGNFIISLDLELFWGVRHNKSISSYGKNISGVHEVIPKLLVLFHKYDINVTFAIVGLLFFENKGQMLKSIPERLPNYYNKMYSPYTKDIYEVGESYIEDKYNFGLHLVELIKKHSNHEIGTHTFSHYFCIERGQTLLEFQDDIDAACKIAKEKNIKLESIVFPRNQYTIENLEKCKEVGIKCYRNHDKSWLYRGRNSSSNFILINIRKILRFLDSYFIISGYNCFDSSEISKTPICGIPGSFFLRPFSKKFRILEPLKVFRIQRSIIYAAKNKKGFHLWWHPHNYGVNQIENLYNLEKILKTYQQCSTKYGMKSVTMTEFADNNL